MASPSTPPTPAQAQAEMQALLNGPAGRPPVGVMPNLDNPPTLNEITIAVLTTCIVITTVTVFIRMYTKLFLIRSTAYEDYIIVIAWVGQVGLTVPSVYCFKSGGGYHMWDIQMEDFFRVLYWVNISGILYGIIVTLIKLSILLQYLRIFVPNRKVNVVLFIAIQILIWSIFLFYLVNTIFVIVMCSPREKIWNPLMTTGHCFNAYAEYIATGTFNVISDFSILVLPMVPIWKLQMPLTKKIMITAIFATGVCACAASVLRTYYTWKTLKSPDISYNLIIMGLWTCAEITTGIAISCLPVTPKFFQHFGSKVYGIFSRVSKSSSKIGLDSGSTDIKKKIGLSARLKRPFGKYSSGESRSGTISDSSNDQPQPKGEYITLNEVGVAASQSGMINGRSHLSAQGRPTRRDDLETGHYTL